MAASLLMSCSPTDSVSPEPEDQPKPSFLFDLNPCFTQAWANCHGQPVFSGGYQIPFDGGGAWVCDMTSPNCVPRAMSANERAAYVRAMTMIQPWCANYSTYISGRNAAGKITVYDWDDGDMGDAHYPFGSFMHLNAYRAFVTDKELARTLIHEAWHLINVAGDPATGSNPAEMAAIWCVP
ncbi:MAG: hypothetical protein ACKVZ0_12505 [Gemmatimonadales bacterium]